jgi:hypothetical protein
VRPNGRQEVVVATGVAALLALCHLAALAAVPPAAPGSRAAAAAPGRAEARQGPFVLHLREGVTVVAEEPEGWRGDAEAARHKGAHLLFFPPAPRTPGVLPATIRVRVNPKADEDTAGDLAAELDGYRGTYPALTSAELSAHHPTYDTVATVLFRPGLFYEYIAYLNPGRDVPWSVTVTLSKPRAPATSSELAAFETVVRSIAVTAGVPPAREPGASR